VPNLAEFYANYVVTNRVVTSTVNGRKLFFNAKELGAILSVPSEGFDVYVHEDKNMLGAKRLVELTRRLSQKSGLVAPRSVKKGEMKYAVVELRLSLGLPMSCLFSFDTYAVSLTTSWLSSTSTATMPSLLESPCASSSMSSNPNILHWNPRPPMMESFAKFE